MDIPEDDSPPPTREQLAAWLAGDAEAARGLFARHRDELLARAQAHRLMRPLRRQVTPEDVVDEVFLRALSSGLFRRFEDRGKGSLMGALYTVLDRVLADQARRHFGTQKRGAGVEHVALDEALLGAGDGAPASGDPTPTSHARASDLLDICRTALPAREWEVWRLRQVESLDFGDIAGRLHLSESAVRGLHFRAKERIVTLLGRSQRGGA
jgi:RNA polymerase sigma factor (sigma-70 family)